MRSARTTGRRVHESLRAHTSSTSGWHTVNVDALCTGADVLPEHRMNNHCLHDHSAPMRVHAREELSGECEEVPVHATDRHQDRVAWSPKRNVGASCNTSAEPAREVMAALYQSCPPEALEACLLHKVRGGGGGGVGRTCHVRSSAVTSEKPASSSRRPYSSTLCRSYPRCLMYLGSAAAALTTTAAASHLRCHAHTTASPAVRSQGDPPGWPSRGAAHCT